VGKNYPGYGQPIAENFLHLLENFANNESPANPVEGQLWYDNGTNILRVFDGTEWAPTGSIKKSNTAPTLTNTTGDIWVDTLKKQLYISSGSTWLLVGPQYSNGIKTGPETETITDTDNVDHLVTTLFAENERIAIVSKSAFTPKTTLIGFPAINQGLNLSKVDSASATNPSKFWGRSSEADALNVNGSTIDASNFLRSDITSTTNNQFNIRSKNGISIGADLSFSISTDTSTLFYSKSSGKNINVRVNHAGDAELNPGEYIALSIGSNTKIGIGPDNVNPLATLDVKGDFRSSGNIYVTNTGSSANGTYLGDENNSIATEGSLSINGKSFLGDSVVTYGPITLNKLQDLHSGSPIIGTSVIVPGATNSYDIGSSSLRFRNIWASTIIGNVQGTFSGPLSGTADIAKKLENATTFRIRGDVTSSPDIQFDGETTDGTVTFNTIIGADIINAKTEVFDTYDSDTLIVYRGGNVSPGLKKTTKASFIANIPTVPVGAIFPFAGPTPPSGYLLCDGSEVSISRYIKLFEVIGYAYKPSSNMSGQAAFALPDLRGRFALGRDNMDNEKTIPDKNSPEVLIDAGGGSSNRVTSAVADSLGSGSGSEQTTIQLNNLPEHKHNMSSSSAQYYAAGVPGTTDINALPGRGLPTGTIDGYGLPNSGGVISTSLSQPLNIMNPYLTINYIIYTGVAE
jgi:microcystin-dependent protein